ncbi:hypothetical protein Acsp01_27430 [Actinoplanes sp. NBRC 101535]|nr:hypothetical protein Acsp01_27430 [Actinoplanes sp. NBRC 101535]
MQLCGVEAPFEQVGEDRASRPAERGRRAPPAVQVLIRQRVFDVAALRVNRSTVIRARSDALEAPQLPG